MAHETSSGLHLFLDEIYRQAIWDNHIEAGACRAFMRLLDALGKSGSETFSGPIRITPKEMAEFAFSKSESEGTRWIEQLLARGFLSRISSDMYRLSLRDNTSFAE